MNLRSLVVATVGLCAVVCSARPAEAQRLSPTPTELVTQLRGAVPGILRAVTTDIDRDGDLDVVASTTGEPVVVWINDGHGHLTRQHAPPVPFAMASEGQIAADSARDVPGAPPTPKWHGSAAVLASTWAVADTVNRLASSSSIAVIRRSLVTGPSRGPPVAPTCN